MTASSSSAAGAVVGGPADDTRSAKTEGPRDQEGDSSIPLVVPWIVPLKAALNHGGTRRPKRDRREAKRKQVQLATVDPKTGRPSVRTISFRGFLSTYQLTGASSPSAGSRACGEDTALGAIADDTCLLLFVTDDRAAKVQHLGSSASGGFVEVCWWLDDASVQFRIAGRGLLGTSDSADPELRALRRSVWGRLKASTCQTFLWPQPGLPRGSVGEAQGGDEASGYCREDAVDEIDEVDSPGAAAHSLEDAHFAVVVVVPDSVDELRLGGNQRRTLYTLQEPLLSSHDEVGLSFAKIVDQMQSSKWRVEEVNP